MSQQNLNQPEIITQTSQKPSLSELQKRLSELQNSQAQSKQQRQKTEQNQLKNDNNSNQQHIYSIQNIRKKHPDCIPVFFVKHQDCSKQFPSPVTPFILFKKDLKIEQAMYSLYNQIKVKGLYFFCMKYLQNNKKDQKKDKNFKSAAQIGDKISQSKKNSRRFKYVIIKPEGQTIQTIYKNYGTQGYLTLIYGDKNIGMGGINRLQRWLVRLLIILVIAWIVLSVYPYLMIFYYGGTEALYTSIMRIGDSDQVNLEKNKANLEDKNILEKMDENIEEIEEDIERIPMHEDSTFRQKSIEINSQNQWNSHEDLL